MQRLVIIGAGGFGREVFSMIREINEARPTWDVIGFLDDNRAALDGFSQYPPLLGPIDRYPNLPSVQLTCAIGSPKVRKQIVERLAEHGARWATILHPTVRIGVGSTVGTGCILCTRSGVTVDVRVGNHVHINSVAGGGHDVHMGDFCTLSSHVDVCGGAILGEGAFLGSHAVVLPGVRIGAWASVGAGSVAISDVPAGKTVFGVPAKGIFVRTTAPADDNAPAGETGEPQRARSEIHPLMKGP